MKLPRLGKIFTNTIAIVIALWLYVVSPVSTIYFLGGIPKVSANGNTVWICLLSSNPPSLIKANANSANSNRIIVPDNILALGEEQMTAWCEAGAPAEWPPVTPSPTPSPTVTETPTPSPTIEEPVITSLSAPSNLRFESPTLACGATTNATQVTVIWDPVENAVSYDYEIDYPLPEGGRSIWTTIKHTNFHSGAINEGTSYIKVRAVAADGTRSDWSELCAITRDSTAPAQPTGLHWDNVSRTKSYACGATAPRAPYIPDWNDIADDATFSHYEYTSFWPDGAKGLIEMPLVASEFVNDWVPPYDGFYGFAVRSVDTAGNKSAWALSGDTLAESCTLEILLDEEAPELLLPDDFTEEAQQQFGAVVTYVASATDDVTSPLDVTCAPESGTLFPMGPTTVNCSATDDSGKTTTGSFVVTVVDTIKPPKPTGLHRDNQARTKSYACGDVVNLQTLIPDWDDISDDPTFSHFEYTSFNPGGSIGINEQVLYVSEFVHSWVPTIEDTHGYAVRSVDFSGNKSDWALFSKTLSGSCQITYDSTAPSVEITNPIDMYVRGDVSVRGTVQDENLFRYWTVVHKEGTTSPTIAGLGTVNTTVPFTDQLLFTWDTTETPDGEYTIKLEARDQADNKNSSSVHWKDVIVDNTAPTVDLVFPVIGTTATYFQAVFSENVRQEDAENPENYFLNNWPGAGGSGNLLGDATIEYDETTFTATITFTNPGWYVSPEQQWGVSNVRDLAGNPLSVSPYIEYSTPMIAPVTTDDSPSGWQNSDITVTLTCDDGTLLVDASGCKTTYYRVNGGSWQTGNTVVLTEEGEHTLEYYSTDNAGNSETEKTATNVIKIDKTLPFVFVPENQTFDEDETGTYFYSFEPTASENEFETLAELTDTLPVNCNYDPTGYAYPAGVTTVTCSATDRAGNVKSESFTITVNNLVPSVTIAAELLGSGAYTFTAAVLGGNTPYTYAWSGSCSGTTAQTTTATTPGTYNCSLLVTDADGDTDTESISRTIPAPVIAAAIIPAVQGVTTEDEEDEETEETEEEQGEVLGERICSDKTAFTAIFYVDKNNNGQFDEGEAYEGTVEGSITYEVDGITYTADTFKAEFNGLFVGSVCPGDYTIKVTPTSLPNTVDVAGVYTITVSETGPNNVFFALLQKEATQKSLWWLWWLIATIVAFMVFIGLRYRKNQYSS